MNLPGSDTVNTKTALIFISAVLLCCSVYELPPRSCSHVMFFLETVLLT